MNLPNSYIVRLYGINTDLSYDIYGEADASSVGTSDYIDLYALRVNPAKEDISKDSEYIDGSIERLNKARKTFNLVLSPIRWTDSSIESPYYDKLMDLLFNRRYKYLKAITGASQSYPYQFTKTASKALKVAFTGYKDDIPEEGGTREIELTFKAYKAGI